MEKKSQKTYDIFISYRRQGGEIMARFLFMMLADRGYSVFYDRECLRTGRYDEDIKQAIENCCDFILILSPRMFDGKSPENDEVLKEVIQARKNQKNLLPLQMSGFEFPDESYHFPDEISDFRYWNAPQVKIEAFNYTFLQGYLKSSKSNLPVVLKKTLVEANEQEDIFKYKEITDEVKEKTIKNILNSYMALENTEMILNMIKPYMGQSFNEKKDFRYILGLRKDLEHLKRLPIKDIDKKYYRLSERLQFTKHYIQSDGVDTIGIAFDFKDDSLDSHLRTEHIFFSESLKLQKEDMEMLQNASPEEMKVWYDEVFKVQLAINGNKRKYDEIKVDKSGMVALYHLEKKTNTIAFKISFEIPYDAENNHIYLAISEPTFSPEILVRYDDCFETEMVPFFDKDMTLENSGGFEGEYEFAAPNTWVMPMSGAIIKTRVKKEEYEDRD